ncbi:MAG: hypothetical protein SVK54_07615 [candidate division WOR-3 bacterium]|nr:hypothetical protein [candidate division WOR-3 bacterium]
MKIIVSIICMIFALGIFPLAMRSDGGISIGYLDENGDGVNDLYRDSNGDGINDKTGEIVAEDIPFRDDDNDSVNDLFSDSDGDGVNDLYTLTNTYPVIDIDRNNINDIIGNAYSPGFYHGVSFGSVLEELNIVLDDFSDQDGDLMDDRFHNQLINRIHDRFIDRNNDGISDIRKKYINSRKNKGRPQ